MIVEIWRWQSAELILYYCPKGIKRIFLICIFIRPIPPPILLFLHLIPLPLFMPRKHLSLLPLLPTPSLPHLLHHPLSVLLSSPILSSFSPALIPPFLFSCALPSSSSLSFPSPRPGSVMGAWESVGEVISPNEQLAELVSIVP